MNLRQAYPSVALAMGLFLVIESIIVVLCLFDNFTMKLLDTFSMIYMAESGVTVTTICNEAAVDSFRSAHFCSE